ncbi:MAG: tRNA glutamyl-Q(34) synthetase GluQRS [Pseudomonadota bacterium]
MIRERFAPSPTGYLHLGHAFSALTAFEAAAGGQFLLRIEDIDGPRSKPEFEKAIFEDLAWLGLHWETPVMRQSDRMADYQNALAQLVEMDLCYPCSCTRKDIEAALSAPQEGAGMGPDGVIYPGTCRHRSMASFQAGDAVRLDMEKATQHVGSLQYVEIGDATARHRIEGRDMVAGIGDIVLARKDIGTSYHLAVVVDDAAQQISHVTRGADMATATPIHVLLQQLLELPAPIYRHHRLIRDENGKRLAKRHDALAIRSLRDQGLGVSDIRAMVGL